MILLKPDHILYFAANIALILRDESMKSVMSVSVPLQHPASKDLHVIAAL